MEDHFYQPKEEQVYQRTGLIFQRRAAPGYLCDLSWQSLVCLISSVLLQDAFGDSLSGIFQETRVMFSMFQRLWIGLLAVRPGPSLRSQQLLPCLPQAGGLSNVPILTARIFLHRMHVVNTRRSMGNWACPRPT